jgi:hypothetical protein
LVATAVDVARGEAVDVAMGVVAMGMAIDLLEQVFCS